VAPSPSPSSSPRPPQPPPPPWGQASLPSLAAAGHVGSPYPRVRGIQAHDRLLRRRGLSTGRAAGRAEAGGRLLEERPRGAPWPRGRSGAPPRASGAVAGGRPLPPPRKASAKRRVELARRAPFARRSGLDRSERPRLHRPAGRGRRPGPPATGSPPWARSIAAVPAEVARARGGRRGVGRDRGPERGRRRAGSGWWRR
jgi:hypothetical protein